MLPIAPDTLLQQRYRILNMLGEEEFGRTYLATDRDRPDEYCAIEEMIPSAQFPGTVAKAKEVFQQEATLLYQLQHLQLPRFWTTFEDQNRLFLVRDYIEGKTYRQILDDRRDEGKTFSEAEVRQFLQQILPVIGYIHSKGTIHRNISPANIICRESDSLPVPIDFGVVREFANKLQAAPSIQQVSVGQPGYAPAEQLKQGQVYPHSDLYALAVTAIVLLTGKEPSALFEGDLMNWDWRKWTQIDDRFADVLGRMLSPHPTDRYQSVAEVAQDLQSIAIPDPHIAEYHEPYRPSELPTIAVGGKSMPSATDPAQTAITNPHVKSEWEKPQVFIPAGVLTFLLIGFGSWFGVTQLLHRPSPEPIASTPPKQIDFNNPTIPNDASGLNPAAGDLIQPALNRPIVKEGTVDANTPVRYRISAVAGQNLDIQLVPAASQSVDGAKTTMPINPAQSIPSPANPTSASPKSSQSKDPQSNNPPISVPTPVAATQVLMTVLSPAGTPIDSQADRVIGWRGEISTAGDYTIELRPIKGLAGSTFPYKLSVTQLATLPSPSPAAENMPSPGSTPPVGVPAPVGGNGVNDLPTSPKPNLPDNNGIVPGIAPSPIPVVVPTTNPRSAPVESERPRNRRRNRRESEPSPQVRERKVDSSEEATSTPRRRRNRVESTEEATPTPRRRRNRVESTEEAAPTPRRKTNQQDNSETQSKPSPSTKPDSGDNIPVPEPSVGIPVPAAKNATPQRNRTDSDKTAPPSGSGLNDQD